MRMSDWSSDVCSSELRNREQGKPRHQHTSDRTRPESDRQTALQAGAGCFGRADIGANGNVHADIARRARKHGSEVTADGCDIDKTEEYHDGDSDANNSDTKRSKEPRGGKKRSVRSRCRGTPK